MSWLATNPEITALLIVTGGDLEGFLENERALLWTTDILREAGSAPDVLAQVREILEEDFTPAEVTTILSKAGQRARRPQR